MVKQAVPTLRVYVAGDTGNGKTNFINGFLHYYPPSAEVRRKNDTKYFMYKQDKHLKIQLHDVSSVESIENHFYDNLDVVFFCYSANDPGSFLSLEKWIRSIQTSSVKEIHSFLVADLSNLGDRRDIADNLAEEARGLKGRFGIKRFIECSFLDNESTYGIFQNILDEVSPPKVNKLSLNVLYKEYPQKMPKTCLSGRSPLDLLGPYAHKTCHICCLDSGDRNVLDKASLPKVNKLSPSKLYEEYPQQFPEVHLAEKSPFDFLEPYLHKMYDKYCLDSEERDILEHGNLSNPCL